jgi:ribonuclease T2
VRLALRALALLGLVALGTPVSAQQSGQPGKFDYYVLSLSWSPSYCASEGNRAEPTQCRRGKPFAFVVHGLWPQYSEGWPQDCQYPAPRVPEATVKDMLDVMPSRRLVIHEWRKHGTCSGLDPDDYFDAVRGAFNKIVIPGQFRAVTRPITTSAPEVENAFRVANPGLAADMIAVSCEARMVSEVRICMDRSLGFTACPAVDRRACRAGKITMPPMRGG